MWCKIKHRMLYLNMTNTSSKFWAIVSLKAQNSINAKFKIILDALNSRINCYLHLDTTLLIKYLKMHFKTRLKRLGHLLDVYKC